LKEKKEKRIENS